LQHIFTLASTLTPNLYPALITRLQAQYRPQNQSFRQPTFHAPVSI